MFVREAISYGRNVASPLEAEMLLSFVLCLSREYLIAHPEHKISEEAVSRFQKYCEARANGIPLAYLTRRKEFYGLDFYVDERVLIPRPETEMLVGEAITLLQTTNYKLQTLLDIGTGSGCIAISLAKNLPNAKIIAVDISEGALEVAQKNAKFHGVSSQIEFIKSDLLENVTVSLSKHVGGLDGIVANLPYIGTTEHHLISKEVLEHEPHSALFSGENGLELYERLFDQILILQQAHGDKAPKWFIGEIGFLQQEALEKLIHKYFGNISVQFKNDLSGLPRMFSLCFKS